jgi:serine/threonine protein kinase
MPFVQSGTLADLMQKGRLSLPEIRRIMTQIGDALAYAHARGMIHRDIKPSNVLIDERGNCLLTDFGLARMADASAKLTSSGAVMGTPAYMSPEQGQGVSVDHRSDIYALGVIFYELVTGRVPYTAETPIAIVFKHISDPLPSARKLNPDLDEAIELVLFKALAKNPDDRYQNAEDFVRAIQSAISDKPIAHTSAKLQTEKISSIPQSAIVNTAASTKQPAKLPTWIFALLGIIVLGSIAFFVFGNRPNDNNIPPTSLPAANTSTSITIASTSTSIPSPQPTPEIASETGFTDNFDGQLADGWDWINEDPANWSLSAVPGYLQINAADASLDGPTEIPNILVHYTDAQKFEATTHLRFNPSSNFQFAGFIIVQDGSNALQFGRGFCDYQNLCAGNGLYFDNITDSVFSTDNFKIAFSDEEAYLRLTRDGNLYTAYYSTDGETWIEVGKHRHDFTSVYVGLTAAQAPAPIAAQFDFFTLQELP